MTQEELMIFYRTNDDFKAYVDNYIHSVNPWLSVVKALRVKEVRKKAEELMLDDRK